MQQYILPVLQWGCFFLLICTYSFVLNVVCVGYKYFLTISYSIFPIIWKTNVPIPNLLHPSIFIFSKKMVKIHITQSIMSNFLIFHYMCVCVYLSPNHTQVLWSMDRYGLPLNMLWVILFLYNISSVFSKINILITILSTTNKYGCLWITLAPMHKISFI